MKLWARLLLPVWLAIGWTDAAAMLQLPIPPVIAQAVGYSLVHLIIMAVIIAACVGILYVALQQFGVAIPRFVVAIFWIVVCAVVAIFAIRFVASM